MMKMHNDYYRNYKKVFRDRPVDYSYKDSRELQAEAINKKMVRLQNAVNSLKTELENKTFNKPVIGEMNSNRLRIRVRVLEREMASLSRELKRINTRTDEQIMDTASLERNNAKYEKQVLKIDDYETELSMKKEAALNMKNGFAKQRACKKIAKMEKKLNKMKKKGVKLQKKQLAKLVRRNNLKLFKNKKANKLLAKRDVYLEEIKDAQMSSGSQTTRREQRFYDNRVVRYTEKKRKVDEKINALRAKKVVAQGGKPRTINRQSSNTSSRRK